MTAAAGAVPSTARLDMSLDDLIKHNKSAGRGGDMRPAARRGSRPGIMRRNYFPRSSSSFRYRQSTSSRAIARTYRPSPYGLPSKFSRRAVTSDQGVWQHDMFDLLQRPLGIETGTKLYISNLDYGVSTDDIKELFSEVGDLKRCSIHYDPSGRSKGTAEVVYSRKVDGIAALKRYNNVQLDGKSMKIEFIGSNLNVTPTLPSSTTNGSVSNRFYAGQDSFRGQPPNRPTYGMGSRRRSRFFGSRRGFRGRGRSGRGGRGRGRGQGQGGRGQIAFKSAADLDAELETYHSDAMQT